MTVKYDVGDSLFVLSGGKIEEVEITSISVEKYWADSRREKVEYLYTFKYTFLVSRKTGCTNDTDLFFESRKEVAESVLNKLGFNCSIVER